MLIKKTFVKLKSKMNFSSIGEIALGIFPTYEYDKTVDCFQSAISKKQILYCKNITAMIPYDVAFMFLLQVKCISEFAKKNNLFRA
jgi:hypothetical protein